MRVDFAGVYLVSAASVLWLSSLIGEVRTVRADEAAELPAEPDPETIAWEEAFAPISAADAEETLVFLLISNDHLEKSRDGKRAAATPLWCQPVFGNSLRRALATRPQLRRRIVLERLPVGIPPRLTGGQSRNQPSRAVVAVCNGHYRLLALTVGVPDEDQLLTLIEDAEEVQSLWQLHAGDRGELIQSLAKRSEKRLSRRWTTALREMVTALGDGRFRDDKDTTRGVVRKQQDRLMLLAGKYHPIYHNEARQRFGLGDAGDAVRLAILEQHPDTRAAWVDAMMPFLAQEDFFTLWRPLCEWLWRVPPIRDDDDGDELVQWYEDQITRGPVVLSLKPILARSRWRGNGVTSTRRNSDSDWTEVQRLALESPLRIVDVQQLATLMRRRDIRAIDIQLPSPVVYLLFDSDGLAAVLRENESPRGFAVRLKKATQ